MEYYPHLREANEELQEQYSELLRDYESLEEALDDMTQYLQIVFAELPSETANELLTEYPDLLDVIA